MAVYRLATARRMDDSRWASHAHSPASPSLAPGRSRSPPTRAQSGKATNVRWQQAGEAALVGGDDRDRKKASDDCGSSDSTRTGQGYGTVTPVGYGAGRINFRRENASEQVRIREV